jgi:microcystin degradation protein MlrC
MKIGILAFIHESNSFVRKQTRIVDFNISRDNDILTQWSNSHHEIWGFIRAAHEKNLRILPLLSATAIPSGILTRDTYETILKEMIETISKRPVDGLLLALHGAMVAEGYEDADGNTAKQLREILGEDKPIVMTLDCHANLSKLMVENVNTTILYRTNPHIDQFERGREAVTTIKRLIQDEINPTQYVEQIPLIINISKQNTKEEPLLSLMNKIERIRTKKGILSVSLGLGFAFSDVEKMGTSLIVVTDNNQETAKNIARFLGRYVWNMRNKFLCELPSPEEAIKEARLVEGTVVLMDVGDNIGGGGPGDSTLLLREVLEQGLEKVLVIITDPEAVQRCLKSSIGEMMRLHVGAKQDSFHGSPIEVKGSLKIIHDGRFIENKPRHGGQREYNQGTTIVIETKENHLIILNSLRTPPFSLNQITSLGIDPREMQIIIAKGVIAPIAAYEPIAEKIITVNNIYSFNYKRRRFPLYPLEKDAIYL